MRVELAEHYERAAGWRDALELKIARLREENANAQLVKRNVRAKVGQKVHAKMADLS